MNGTGYRAEKFVAAALNMERTGAAGKAIEDLTDARTGQWGGRLKVEIKAGKQIPTLVVKAFKQLEPHVGDDQLGILVMVPKGIGEAKIRESLVVMSLGDFIDWFGDFDQGEPDRPFQRQPTGVHEVVLRMQDGREVVLPTG